MDEYMTVELTLDNDEVVECAILTLFEAGGKEYIALLPLNEDGETEARRRISLPLYGRCRRRA